MNENNPLKMSKRLKEIFIDYLVVLIYLLLLFIASLTAFFLILKQYPSLPIFKRICCCLRVSSYHCCFFSVLDSSKSLGTFGKRKAGLIMRYKTPSFLRSMVRSFVKFLPWELAHIGVINGFYAEHASWAAVAFSCAGHAIGDNHAVQGAF
jgi:hypothetical protein